MLGAVSGATLDISVVVRFCSVAVGFGSCERACGTGCVYCLIVLLRVV